MNAEARKERPSDPTRTDDPLIGAHIEGRYIVERIQGRGGTSVVYAGIHEELQREVAIKVLDEASAADPEALERFVFEARMGSSIAHGNVVGVSDFGHLPDGRPFLVMPMIAGTDMATMLAQEGPQHPRRVAALLKGVAAALGLMHARGIVHRDIKSENLMHVAHEDGTETSLVLDFGITAMRVGEADYEDGSGTPEFMPPEALNGEAFDFRGDIYSLATVAFELITGVLPFEGADPHDLRRKKSSYRPRSLTAAGEMVYPAALELAMARGLSRRPEDRQASANEFIRELELAAEMVPDRTPAEVAKRLKRASMFPTLVGTGGQMPHSKPTHVKMKIERKVVESSATLKTLALRAARFSSSLPAPPPIGSLPTAPVIPPAAPVPRIERTPLASPLDAAPQRPVSDAASPPRPASAPDWHSEDASFESGVHLMPTARDSDPANAPAAITERMHAIAPSDPLERAASRARVSTPAPASSLAPRTLALRDEDIDMRSFRPRVFSARRLMIATLASAAVLGMVSWSRMRAPHAVPATASTATTGNAPLVAAAEPALRAPSVTPPSAALAVEPVAPVATPSAGPSAAFEPEPVAFPIPIPAAPAAPVPMVTSSAIPVPTATVIEPAPTVATSSAPPVEEREVRTKSRSTSSSRKPSPRAERRTSSTRPHVDLPSPTPAPAARVVIRPAREPAPPVVSVRAKGDPDRARALTELGTEDTLRGDFSAAVQHFQQAIAADPGNAAAWRGKALALERVGRTADAITAFRQFLKLSPSGAAADKIRARLRTLESGH